LQKFYPFKIAVCVVVALSTFSIAVEPNSVEYKAEIEGLNNRSLKKVIKESALSFKLESRPPATLGQLHRRAEKDRGRIERLMKSRGYYESTVAVKVDSEQQPVVVCFTINPGLPYRFGTVNIRFRGSSDPALKKIIPRIKRKGVAEAMAVFVEEQRILERLRQKGYPFPLLIKRTVSVDALQQQVNLVLEFDPGVLATYGAIKVEGLETLKPNYIHRQLPWKEGDKYDAQQVADFENELLSSGLFGTARVEAQPPPTNSLTIPIKISVSERHLRTIRLGVGYSDVGPNAKMIWEHRNLWGNGERLRTELAYSPIEYKAAALLERPNFLVGNQILALDAEVVREQPDAYNADKLLMGAIVKHEFNRYLMAGTGVRYKYSSVEQLVSVEKYSHIIFPLFLELDNRNDRLNPVKGGQFFARTRFYEDMNGSDSFFKTEAEGRLYQMFWKRPRLSGAVRLTLGTINGASVEKIPADERFYAGGGGSIRGYEYQAVGPQLGETPLGGSQLLEFSAEMRMQPGNKLGYAAFVDGGTVYNDLIHDSDRSLRYGAGVGIRWFTGIGPLRVDVAYPLNPTAEQVRRVQFYISLGQAF